MLVVVAKFWGTSPIIANFMSKTAGLTLQPGTVFRSESHTSEGKSNILLDVLPKWYPGLQQNKSYTISLGPLVYCNPWSPLIHLCSLLIISLWLDRGIH